MTRKFHAALCSVSAALALLLAGCSATPTPESKPVNPDTLQVVATFSVIADIVQEIGGEHVQVHSIVPLGAHPHEYTPLSEDIKRTTDASLIFWNGLNMELGDGWFESLLEVSGHSIGDSNVIEVSTGVNPMYLTEESSGEHEVNPHAFLDPNVGMMYVKNVLDAFVQADPKNAAFYEQSAEQYLAELSTIDADYREKIMNIPPEHRFLVTSENAFQYMAQRYGLDVGYIWAIDTEDTATPHQLNRLIDQLSSRQIPALFVETNADPRPMEMVSEETRIPIFGDIFSDELGSPGKTGGTYLGMLRHNIDQISAGLGGNTP